MQWIQSNPIPALAVALLVAWIGQMVGPSAVRAARRAAAAAWPRLKPAINAKNLALPLVAVALFGVSMIPRPAAPEPATPPRVPDLFDQQAATARALLSDELDQIAGQRFKDAKEREDAINQKIDDIVKSSFEPLFGHVSKAADENRLTELSKKIREGEFRE